RAFKASGVYNGPPAVDEIPEIKSSDEEYKVMKFSPDGKFLVRASSKELLIYCADTYKVLCTISDFKVIEISFSPKSTYLMTYERFVKSEDAEQHRNVKLFETATGSLLCSFTKKSYADWALKWTEDEAYCAQMFPNSVYFYKPSGKMDPAKPIMKLQAEGLKSFSISPGLSPSVAVFIPERKGAPAAIRMYSLGNFKAALSNKSFYKAEGVSLLVVTHTDVDNTGKSYYGETNLYYLTSTGTFDCKVPLSKEGPIYDVAWHPNEKEFIVIYGFMPAKVSLFDSRATEIFNFGTESRNMVRFNPQGRVFAIAGFGNLSGMVDIWDYNHKKLLKSIDAHGSSSLNWSPCGRYLMAATLSPRLRVDNGFSIWHYSGQPVHRRYINELYDVQWCPKPASLFPQKGKLDKIPANIVVHIDKNSTKPETPVSNKPAGVYRPPHARNSPTPAQSQQVLYQRKSAADNASPKPVPPVKRRIIPGAPPPQPEKQNNQNQGRSEKKEKSGKGPNNDKTQKKKEKEQSTSESSLSEKARKMLVLQKRMKQIEALERKQSLGIVMTEAQLEKIKSKDSLTEMIKALNL
ncbi:hypothetical protein BB560_003431, partial [Smittium megazygosporum]